MLKTEFIQQAERLDELRNLVIEIVDSNKPLPRLFIPGNSKIGKNAIHYSGIPIYDCPEKSEWCADKCYAIKFFLWHGNKIKNKISINKTFKLLKDGFWGSRLLYSSLIYYNNKLLYNIMCKDLKTTNIKYVRFHEDGDFVSKNHLLAAIKLAKQFREVNFWSYTKLWQDKKYLSLLLEANKLKNLSLRFSTDISIMQLPKRFYKHAAFVGVKDIIPKFTCPHQLLAKKHKPINLTCAGGGNKKYCGLCWDQKKAVEFLYHI